MHDRADAASATDIAIIGAGELGGALAHALARRDIARAIRLVDETGRVAAGKALDIVQAAPIERFATELSGSADVSAAAGAAIVVLADRAGKGEWQGEDGLMLLKRLAHTVAGAVVICAGSSQRELVERGVMELHMTRTRLLGSAPEALAAAARAIVALEINGSPGDVALTMLGVPPAQVVIPWDDATIGGFSATRMLDEPSRRRIAARVRALWPPGPYALAAAAVKAIEAIIGRSRRQLSCFVAADTSAGSRQRTAALPVRLGPSGIVEVVLPELSVYDRVAFDNAILL
jgi:malate dehydrogenase